MLLSSSSGYASTFVAGFLGLIYIGARRVYENRLDGATAQNCWAGWFTALSVLPPVQLCRQGPCLGGISGQIKRGGDFGAWDPKENCALINGAVERADSALVLCLMIRAAWLALCAVRRQHRHELVVFFLRVLTCSYGFTYVAFKWLMLFVGSQIVFIILWLLPGSLWEKFRRKNNLIPRGFGRDLLLEGKFFNPGKCPARCNFVCPPGG